MNFHTAATVIDHTNGTYDLYFRLEKSGDHLGVVNLLPMGAVKTAEQQQLYDEGRGPPPVNHAPDAYDQVCGGGEHWDVLPVIPITVGPSVTNDTMSSVAGSGLVGGIAGLNISFSIFARDEFGNTQAPGLDEGESFNVLVEYRVMYQQTHRTLSNFEIGAGDNELDVSEHATSNLSLRSSYVSLRSSVSSRSSLSLHAGHTQSALGCDFWRHMF